MAKESQKQKLERLESELIALKENYHNAMAVILDKNKEIADLNDLHDENFEKSAYKKQMDHKISVLEIKLKQAIQDKVAAEKRAAAKDDHIQKLICENLKASEERLEVHKLNNENLNTRGAGRKPKFTDAQIQSIKMYRIQGKKIKEIAALYDCSVGLIHKIIGST